MTPPASSGSRSRTEVSGCGRKKPPPAPALQSGAVGAVPSPSGRRGPVDALWTARAALTKRLQGATLDHDPPGFRHELKPAPVRDEMGKARQVQVAASHEQALLRD